jgi:hypothetical protein
MLRVSDTETRARRDAARLSANVPVYRLSIARRLDAVPTLAERIERCALRGRAARDSPLAQLRRAGSGKVRFTRTSE